MKNIVAALVAVCLVCLPAFAVEGPKSGMNLSGKLARVACAEELGDDFGCENATVVTSVADWEACAIANTAVCIVDSELWCSTTNGAPVCFDPTYSALKYDSTTYFTKRGCLIADNATGVELTSTAIAMQPDADAVLADSVFRFVNLCIEERRGGEKRGYTVVHSGTFTTIGSGTSFTDSVGGIPSSTGDLVTVRVGEATQESRAIVFNLGTLITTGDTMLLEPIVTDTYEVWAHGQFKALDWAYSDSATPIYLEVINPRITNHSLYIDGFGVGQHTVSGCTNATIRGGTIRAAKGIHFDASCAGVVGTTATTAAISTANDTIDFTGAHGFETGNMVAADAANLGLWNANPYYVIDVDSDTIALAFTKHDAGRPWSTSVTWDVDITGSHATTEVTLIEQASLIVEDVQVFVNQLAVTPVLATLTGDLRAEFSNVRSEHGGIRISPTLLVQAVVSDTTFDYPVQATIATFGNGRIDLLCRDMKIVGWGLSKRSQETSDVVTLKDNLWSDCEFELVGGTAGGSDQIFDSTGNVELDGYKFLRFKVTTPYGLEYSDANFQGISHTPTADSRGALLSAGGSNQVSALVGTSWSAVSRGYGPVDGPNIWCVEDGTIVDGDTCCAYRDGLPCEAVLDVTNGGLDNCANDQGSGETFVASCYSPIELPPGW